MGKAKPNGHKWQRIDDLLIDTRGFLLARRCSRCGRISYKERDTKGCHWLPRHPPCPADSPTWDEKALSHEEARALNEELLAPGPGLKMAKK